MEGLHIGHLVKTKIKTTAAESIWVPRSAVVYLGNESIVFIKVNGIFKPHKVQTGDTSGDAQQIVTGLASSAEIAVNAQFLIDSESFIKPDNK
jgi:Cu(I)/Ag(I) efflux system membrane fusion protein